MKGFKDILSSNPVKAEVVTAFKLVVAGCSKVTIVQQSRKYPEVFRANILSYDRSSRNGSYIDLGFFRLTRGIEGIGDVVVSEVPTCEEHANG